MFKSLDDYVEALRVGTAPKGDIIFLDEVDLIAPNLPVFAVYCRRDQEKDGAIYIVCIGVYRDGSEPFSLGLWWYASLMEGGSVTPSMHVSDADEINAILQTDMATRRDRYVDAIVRSTVRFALYGITGR